MDNPLFTGGTNVGVEIPLSEPILQQINPLFPVIEYAIPLILSGSLLLIVSLFIIIRFRSDLRYKQERTKSREAAAETYYRSELLRTQLEVQEQALHHISSEIQENIGQVLTGVQMKLTVLSGKVKDKEEADTFTEVAYRMEKSIKDLRNLSHLLDGSTIEKIGLIDALEKELTFVSSIYNLQCTFTNSGHIPALASGQDLLLFPLVQEATTNIYKYDAATELTIHIGYAAGMLTLHMEDNGKDLDHEHSRNRGWGLQHIQDRIKLLKGNLELNTKPGGGTTALLTCKLNHE